MIQKLVSILCLWAIIGYFVTPMMPVPKERYKAVMLAILMGPLVWFGVLILGIVEFFKPKDSD